MKFCDNPKCALHIDFLAGTTKINYGYKVFERHPLVNGKGKVIMVLCDGCKEAIRIYDEFSKDEED